MKKAVVFAALASVVTMIAACGSDETRLSNDEFLKQGNAICDTGNTAIDAAAAELFASGDEPTPEQLATFGNDVLVPNVQRQIDGLKKLKPPADLEKDVDQMVADAQKALDKISDDPAAALGGDEDLFADVNAQAAAIGLTSCAGDDS